jgi:hypothetical protein
VTVAVRRRIAGAAGALARRVTRDGRGHYRWPIRIGYIIAAHTLPEQLVRLVGRLRNDDARFFIHLDSRAPREVAAVVDRELGDADDVEMLPRQRCQWGAFSQLEVTLAGIGALLAHSERIEYGVLLTGQDYPLRSPREIEETLAAAEGASYLTVWPARGRFLDRVRYRHWFGSLAGRRVRVPHRYLPLKIPRPLPGGLEPFTGTPHWCLARAALERVGEIARERPELVRSFRFTAHPDESFFQTVLMASPLARTIEDDDLRYIDHPGGDASPRVLTTGDLDAMLASRALFARKFDTRVDSRVLDELDARIAAPLG